MAVKCFNLFEDFYPSLYHEFGEREFHIQKLTQVKTEEEFVLLDNEDGSNVNHGVEDDLT